MYATPAPARSAVERASSSSNDKRLSRCGAREVLVAKKKSSKAPPSAAVKPASRTDCAFPPALPKAELHKLLFRQSEREGDEIATYVECQAVGMRCRESLLAFGAGGA